MWHRRPACVVHRRDAGPTESPPTALIRMTVTPGWDYVNVGSYPAVNLQPVDSACRFYKPGGNFLVAKLTTIQTAATPLTPQ